MNSYGFIITRHVNSEITNRYWNHSVKLLRTFYPKIRIIIIDDNSNQDFVKADFDNYNIEIIQSEFPGRGELLPYYYYIKNKFFENAIILHDSVFIHKKINFNILNGTKVLPLWYFNPDKENVEISKKISNNLLNSFMLQNKFQNEIRIGMPMDKWYGCFGVQSYINHNFLLQIEQKYKITNMISAVLCRADRCCLERIMGCIFYSENPNILKIKSLFGDITLHYSYATYTFEQYMQHLKKGTIPRNVVKVWTGR
jgi:hypothetical protein